MSIKLRFALRCSVLSLAVVVIGCGAGVHEMAPLSAPSEETSEQKYGSSRPDFTGPADEAYPLSSVDPGSSPGNYGGLPPQSDPGSPVGGAYGIGGSGFPAVEAPVPLAEAPTEYQRTPAGNESYDTIDESSYLSVTQHPLSTFSIDVDTASYANVRRFLENGQIPPRDAIRVEEMINYFTYDDPPPQDGRPFSVNTEVAECPWNQDLRLVRIGLKGQEVEIAERQPANLVFLVDVSGSMRPENKLPLIKRSLHRLLEELGERDRVAIVTYASGINVPLPSVPANQQHRIASAIDNLVAGGSTNGSAGLHTAYDIARQHFVKFGTNRVILCSDGDFNTGITDRNQLVDLIEGEARSGVFLSVLGFGVGNYKDSLAEQLADHGNGNYAYIDSYAEARKVLIDQMTGTLETIAKDVKVQVEFNPHNVARYRLIGYENRKLASEDFRNDRKDAGEIGAGHSVTALYEIVPIGVMAPHADVPELRYQQPVAEPNGDHADELLTVRLRYKLPDGQHGTEFTQVVHNSPARFEQVSPNLRFATSVATFGMILRDSDYAPTVTWNEIRTWAQQSIGNDERGYRTEFVNMINQAEKLIHRSYRGRDVSDLGTRHFDQGKETPRLALTSAGSIASRLDVSRTVPLLIVIGVSCAMAAIRNRG